MLLASWNQRCSPPWSEKELRDKLLRARRYGREPIGGLLQSRISLCTSTSESPEKPAPGADVDDFDQGRGSSREGAITDLSAQRPKAVVNQQRRAAVPSKNDQGSADGTPAALQQRRAPLVGEGGYLG